MDHKLELTRANRLKVARAFCGIKRVDFSIECAVEGQMGSVYVDDPSQPAAYCVRVGPFAYFAGNADGSPARQLMAGLPAYHLLMPSPETWLDLARDIFGEHLVTLARYSFSSVELSAEHLTRLLALSRFGDRVMPIDLALAGQASEQPESCLDLSDFDGAADFIERGLGYAIIDGGTMIGAAYSSLVCSRGIEVSVYVQEAWRGRGVATALCSRLLFDCLAHGLRPNWDAANRESVRLARKLGYVFLECYDAHYHTLATGAS